MVEMARTDEQIGTNGKEKIKDILSLPPAEASSEMLSPVKANGAKHPLRIVCKGSFVEACFLGEYVAPGPHKVNGNIMTIVRNSDTKEVKYLLFAGKQGRMLVERVDNNMDGFLSLRYSSGNQQVNITYHPDGTESYESLIRDPNLRVNGTHPFVRKLVERAIIAKLASKGSSF